MSQTQNTVIPSWSWMTARVVRILGFGFGTGLTKSAPGTVGTLPAIFVAGLLFGMGMSHLTLLIVAAALFLLGVRICDILSRELGTHDHRGIVWDEFVAMLLVLSCVPQGLGWWLLSFLLFRLFDILKPQPVKWADSQIKGGLGVMLDDAIAAVYTILVVQVLHWLFA